VKISARAAIATAIALIGICTFAVPAAAQEYHSFPSKDCGTSGWVSTSARTASESDTHVITKAGSTTFQRRQFVNYTGAVQTHNYYSAYHRSQHSQLWTADTGPGYLAYSNPCDR
jgi:hypothetical protein